MIELSHVTKTFGGATRALDDLTLTVPQGAVYGLVGSNGAGKTTAIRHITGIFRQDSGSVTIGGLPVYENPAVKSRIGYIPDDLGVFGGGTLRELAASAPMLCDLLPLSLEEIFIYELGGTGYDVKNLVL